MPLHPCRTFSPALGHCSHSALCLLPIPSPPPALTSSLWTRGPGFLVHSEVCICSLDPDDSQSSISSSNLFPSLIQIQIRQLLIMQVVFALSLGCLPSVTLSLSSSPFSPCLAHLLFPICWHWVRKWPSVTRRNKLQVIWDSFQFWE